MDECSQKTKMGSCPHVDDVIVDVTVVEPVAMAVVDVTVGIVRLMYGADGEEMNAVGDEGPARVEVNLMSPAL